MKINAPEKLNLPTLIAGGSVVTVVVLMISLFVGRGLAAKLSTNNKILTKKRQAEQQLAKNLDAIGQLKTEYASLGPKRDLILDALPTSADFPSIVSTMENISKNAGVSLASVTPSEETSNGAVNGLQEYSFNASITGGYNGFKSFLTNVELSLRPMTITTMKINGSSSELNVEMTLKTYFQGPFDMSLRTVPLDSLEGK